MLCNGNAGYYREADTQESEVYPFVPGDKSVQIHPEEGHGDSRVEI